MATAAPLVTIAAKYGLPQFKEDRDFDQWEHEMEIWKMVTDLPTAKHGLVAFLSLNEKVRQQVKCITKEELAAEDGLQKLMDKLRELYAASKDQIMYAAYEKFEEFSRPENMSILNYINEFDRMHQLLKSYEIELPTVTLYYKLLNNANLTKSRRDLARATATEITYDAMKKALKAIHDHCVTSNSDTISTSVIDTEDDDNVLYGNNPFRGGSRNYRNRVGCSGRVNRGGRGGRVGSSRTSPRGPNKDNPCHICGSIFHWSPACPNRDRFQNDQHQDQEYVPYFASSDNFQYTYLAQEASETLNCAVVDSGCPHTVVGKNWLKCFMDTLPAGVILETQGSNQVFIFGPRNNQSKRYKSIKRITIPAKIGNLSKDIITDVVECDVPLLLSKTLMKDACSKLDFYHDEISMYGQKIPLQNTSSGHYCIPIVYAPQISTFLSIDELPSKSNIAVKLHKQFGHPLESEKLCNILKDAKIADPELHNMVKIVTEQCTTCNHYRKARSRPVVSIPIANDFNECLALDIKFVTVIIIIIISLF